MSTSLLYHGFGIIGYRCVRQSFESDMTILDIEQSRGCLIAALAAARTRFGPRAASSSSFRTLPIGSKPTFLMLKVPLACFVLV